MAQFLWIPWRLPRLNELLEQRGRVFRKKTGAARACTAAKPVSRVANGYSVLKKEWERTIWMLARARGFSVMPGCWDFTYLFVEPDSRFDPSNIGAAAVKLIEDALQGSKLEHRGALMAGDGWATVHAIHLHFTRTTAALPIPGVLLGISNQELSQLEMLEQAGRMYHAERVSRRVHVAEHAVDIERAKRAVRGELPRGDQPVGQATTGGAPAPGARVRAECPAEDGGGPPDVDSGNG